MGNPVVHFEIAGPDGPALQQFYQDLFGWNVQVQGPEMGNYGVVMWTEGGIGGGIMGTTDDMPVSNYVTFYIQVDDIQAALDKIAAWAVLPSCPQWRLPRRWDRWLCSPTLPTMQSVSTRCRLR